MSLITDYYNAKEQYSPSRQRVERVLKMINNDLSGKKILDIGCGDGMMGRALKERGAMVFGTDISKSSVEVAAQILNKAFVFDVENDDFSHLETDFDIIIASEVIEHLFRPKDFLAKVKSIMKKDACLIVTTPNFLVWTNRVRMSFGKFEYTEKGLLDESHIHFFTYNSLRTTLSSAGFVVEKENHIIHPKIPESIGRFRPNLFAFQLVVKVKAI